MSRDAVDTAQSRVGVAGATPTYKKYLLTVLMVILAFNLVDRIALGILLQPIKIELHLSDTQLGFLTGIAFALFYSIMGIPIARWADRGNRVAIISITTALWSTAVTLCGLAGSFAQLLLIRIGVAVGEAGCMPTAQSLISDYFARAERPRAISRYMLGYPLSAVLGYFLAGWLNQLYGWRMTFILLGLPGLGLALLAWLTLREPRRVKLASRTGDTRFPFPQSDSAGETSKRVGFREVCVALWTNATFRHLLFGYSVISFFGMGITQWKPVYFIRSFGLQTGEVGTWFAVIYGASGLLGTYLGGELASRYAVHKEGLQLKGMAFGYAFFGIISAATYMSSSVYVAFGLLALSMIGVYTTYGPLFAMFQTIVPPHMRAVSLAFIYLFANLVGLGLGPLAAGALSDALRPFVGEESLRYALLTLSPGYLWGGWHLWWASRTVATDLEVVGSQESSAYRA